MHSTISRFVFLWQDSFLKTQLNPIIVQECEIRLALQPLKAEINRTIEQKMKIISAQEKVIEGLKLALKLKNGYIQRLEQNLGIPLQDRKKLLKEELVECQKQIYANAKLINAEIYIHEMETQV
jgi:hypothetical protein